MQNRRQQKSGFNWQLLLIPVIVLVLLGAAAYSYVYFQSAYTVHPEKVFEENFSTPRDRIKNLLGGGDISSYYDIWLTFDCPDVVHLKDSDWQQINAPSRAAEWWRIHHPEETGTQDYKELDSWSMQRHPNPVEITNGEMLYNRKIHRYYFRIWGRK